MAIVTAHAADIFSALKIGIFYADILNRSFAESKQTDIFCSVIIEIQSADGVTLSVKYTEITIVVISNGCPISPAFCLVAVTAGDIALIDGDIRCEDSVQTVFTVVHLVCEPVQLTGVADLVVSSCLVQRCRLVMCFALFLGAETVFVEVVFSTRCFAVGVTRLVGAVSIEIDYAVALVQNRESVCVLAA